MGFQLLFRCLKKLRISADLGVMFPEGGMKTKVKSFLESFLAIPSLVGGNVSIEDVDATTPEQMDVGKIEDIDFVTILPKPYGFLFKKTSMGKLISLIEDIEKFVSANADKPEKCLFLGLNVFFILMAYRTMIFTVLFPITSGAVKAENIKFSDINLSRSVLNRIKFVNDLAEKTADELVAKEIGKQDLRYLFVVAKRLLIMEG